MGIWHALSPSTREKYNMLAARLGDDGLRADLEDLAEDIWLDAQDSEDGALWPGGAG